MSPTTFPGPHGHDFGRLVACLKQFEGEELVFVPNPGNAGDMLINLGMYKLFDDIGVRYVTGSLSETYSNRVVVYSGGGALVDVYPAASDFFHRNHKMCKNLILLPHTVRSQPELIADMDARCWLFAREANTLAYLQTHCTAAQVHHTDDLAFYLSDADIAGMAWSMDILLNSWRMKTWSRYVAKLALTAKFKDPELYCLRLDAEATDIAIPKHNYDLSKLFAHEDLSFDSCSTTIKTMRFVIKRFDRVSTNRLHIAVLGAILGMPVVMRDNSYGKTLDIYNKSIKGRFENVTFHPM